MAGFKTCGIYPFNPKAIEVSKDDDGIVVVSEGNMHNGDVVVSEGNVDNDDNDKTVENDTDKVQQSSPNASFTVEQEQLFKHRFEEGYNIFIDADYVRWLKLHHPESCPNDGSDCELNNDSVISCFSDILPASPISFSAELTSQLEFTSTLNSVEEPMTEIPVSTTGNTVSIVGPSTSSMVSPSLISGLSTSGTALLLIPGSSTSSAPLLIPGPCTSNTPLSIPGPSTSSALLSVPGPSTSSMPLSVPGPSTSSTPLLVPGPSTSNTPLLVPGSSTSSTPSSIVGTPVHTCATISPMLQQLEAPACSTKGRATPRARLLTSDESLTQLLEKEKKKKEQAEEKERKKQERAEKKLCKENLKKKQEEKARKAEERAKKQQEKKGKQTCNKHKKAKEEAC